jgi:hypothetical protein
MTRNCDLLGKVTCLKPIAVMLMLTGIALNGFGEPIIVGQNNNLTCEWDRSDGPPITNYLWTVQGYAVSNFYISSDLQTGMVVEPFPKTNGQVQFHWADKGNKKVSCDIISMGQKLKAAAKFNAIAPTIDFIGTIRGSVAYDTNYVGSRDGIKCLHFGGAYSNDSVIHGIEFLATNVNPNGIDQITSFGFLAVQTIGTTTRTLTRPDGSTVIKSDAGLDNTFPYQHMGDGDGVLAHDSPGNGFNSDYLTNFVQFSASGSFRQVLVFECFGGMPVPIKEICWNWSGSVSLTNGDGVLTSSNATITVNNHPTTTFPAWTNLVTNKP